MKKSYLIFLSLLLVFTTCKKTSDDSNNNNKGWTEEDQSFYNNILTLQDKAGENWNTWSKTMDSLEAINKLQQFFLSDPSVESATIDSMGIAVEYTNGMGGGIYLNPGRVSGEGRANNVFTPLMFPPVKSLVNIKKLIFLSPAYWEFKYSTDTVMQHYNLVLPKVGFAVQTIYKNEEATLDRFSELAGYGIIHIDSHGWPWINKRYFNDTYMLTGEVVNQNTTEKYADDIKTGRIIIPSIKKFFLGEVNEFTKFYWISGNFIACHNDFSKDTVLFIGSFCYSCPKKGYWTELYKQFAKGTYFGYSGRVQDKYCVIWAVSLMDSLCDTTARTPYNPQKWLDGKVPVKTDQLRTKILFQGDPTLTLWKDSVTIATNPVTNITQSTATGGGNIKSDGGYPITARGVCWSYTGNPTTSNSKTTDGIGVGLFASNLTGLNPDKLYYMRAYATNSKGTLYGNQVTFTTPAALLPNVTTMEVTNITRTTATSGGIITSDGGLPVKTRGICWSISPNPTTINDHIENGSGIGEFEINLSGLTPNTPYYVRAYAINSQGTAYGNEVTFSSSVFFIGQSYGGGLIFYIDGTGKHGLICAPTDQSTGAKWGSDTTLVGGTSTAIGSGQANTAIIVNGDSQAEAARVCNDLDLNGYTDWFLPSLAELGQMSWQAGVIGGFTSMATYWSSSEYDSYLAYCQVVSQGTVFTLDKNISWYYVRAIRTF